MKKIVKTAGLLLSIVLLIAIVGGGLLVAFVNPNQFKPLIAQQVLQHTGRHLTIDGNISWSLFPTLGVKVDHLALDNPAGFSETVFAEIGQATIGIKVLPLLHAKIEATGVTLSGLRLHLIKTPQGKTNWQTIQVQPGPQHAVVEVRAATTSVTLANTTPDAQAEAPAPITSTKPTKLDVSLSIPALDVNDAEVIWQDDATKQKIVLSHATLHAKDIQLNQPFSFSAALDIAANQPALIGHIDISGKAQLDPDQARYAINDFKTKIDARQAGKPITGEISGDVIANLAEQQVAIHHFVGRFSQLPGLPAAVKVVGDVAANVATKTAMLTELNADIANLKLQGNMTVTNWDTMLTAKGRVQAAPFDLKQLLHALKQDVPALVVAKMVTADVNFTATPSSQREPLQAITLHGNVAIDQVKAANLQASHVTTKLQLQNGVLVLAPITAALYQGNLAAEIKITLAANPQLAMQGKLINVQAEPLLQDLGSQGSKMKLKGAATINLQITTTGTTSDDVVRHLNGSGQVSFKDGLITGINIGNLIDTAYAFLKGQPTPGDKDDSTHFGDLTASVQIQNGLLTNRDLSMVGPRFDTKGQGTINLVNQTIQYELLTTAKNIGANHNDKDMLNLYNYAIPVSIAGRLNNPSIRLDTQAIAQEVAKQRIKQVQTQVQDKIRDQVKDKVAGQAGAILQNLLGR